MNSLKILDIHKNFTRGKSTVRVLKGVNLTTSPGEFVAITGTSGSGKSTFLSLIGGFDSPSERETEGKIKKKTKGEIKINEVDIINFSEKELALLRNRFIGFVWQNHQLLSDFSALENVAFPLAIHSTVRFSRWKNNWNAFKEKAMAILADVGLEHRANHAIYELSGGEMQRVSIARALVNDPQIILADEPTGNLDHHQAKEIMNLLIKLTQKKNSTLIVVTHSKWIANISDSHYRLQDGILYSP